MASGGVLHVSYDLRGRPGVAITSAVSDLIEESRHSAQVSVLDLLRVPRVAAEKTLRMSDSHLRMDVFGFPYGLLLRHTLRRAAGNVCRLCRRGEIDLGSFEVVHCHKASFEGLIGYVVARTFGKQLMVTLRQSDYKLLKYRLDLRPLVKRILHQSQVIFFVTPYVVDFLRRTFGPSYFELCIRPKLVFLPNMVERQIPDPPACKPPVSDHEGNLVTILRMTRRSVRRKNLKRLLKALGRMPDGITLRIIGGGDYLGVVKRWVRGRRLDNRVQLLGPVENEAIDRHLQQATAFVMPSHSETFGLVYAEALLNGTPILYSKGTGFDGMFENVGPAVNPRSTRSVHAGLLDVVTRNVEYRQEIQKLSRANAFAVFSRAQVRAVYADTLSRLKSADCEKPSSVWAGSERGTA